MKGVYIITPKGKLKVSNKPITVLELHRQLQEWSDDTPLDDNLIDITDLNPSRRYHDKVIEILEPYKIPIKSLKNLRKGVLIQKNDVHFFD